MGGISFVFSGQGDQYPGMGQELALQYPAAAEVFRICDTIRPGTSQQCFSGTAQELMVTENTQPCLFAMELAAASVLDAHGIRPDAVAGFSLGEVAACTAAGMFSVAEGFRLVCRRGALMQQAAEHTDAAMAAVVKLTAEQVEHLCKAHEGVWPVNYNCPGQTTVTGLKDCLPEFSAAVKAAGGRALPLKVGGGFHSPLMEQAAADFAAVLGSTPVRSAAVPVYSNVTALPYGKDPRQLLAQQICSPVRWEQTIRNLIDAGIDTFIEIGPGKTLHNMIQKISGDVKVYAVADLAAILSEVRPC